MECGWYIVFVSLHPSFSLRVQSTKEAYVEICEERKKEKVLQNRSVGEALKETYLINNKILAYLKFSAAFPQTDDKLEGSTISQEQIWMLQVQK